MPVTLDHLRRHAVARSLFAPTTLPRATHALIRPRQVDAHFDHGKTRNWFGGPSNASTQLLDGMHYRGLLRVAAREGGVRPYAVRPGHEDARRAALARAKARLPGVVVDGVIRIWPAGENPVFRGVRHAVRVLDAA